MLDVIICANFGVEKLRGLGNTRGQILEFPIEMAGHLYNRAGANAQPVITKKKTCFLWTACRHMVSNSKHVKKIAYWPNCVISEQKTSTVYNAM